MESWLYLTVFSPPLFNTFFSNEAKDIGVSHYEDPRTDAGDIGGLLLETVFRFYFVKTILVPDLLKKTLSTKVIFILPVSLILKNKS